MRPRALFVSALLASTALLTSAVASAQTPPPSQNRNVWVMPGAAPPAPMVQTAPQSVQQPRPAPAPAPAAQSVQPAPAKSADASSPSPRRQTQRPPAVAAAGNVPGIAVAPTVNAITRDYTFNPPPPAPAEAPAKKPAAKPSETHFDLGIGTEAPISVGGVATLEVPHRILFQVNAGILPKGYADAIDGFLTGVGAYDATVSSMVRGSISNSFVFRGSLGLRPFEGHGFEILGGYTLITAGGSVATTDVLNAILAESGSALQAPAGLGEDIPISATLHNFHASIGWRWLLADDHLVIRASLSYLQTVAANVQVKVPSTATALVPYEGQINETVNSYLSPYFAKYAKAPTLGLSAAVRF